MTNQSWNPDGDRATKADLPKHQHQHQHQHQHKPALWWGVATFVTGMTLQVGTSVDFARFVWMMGLILLSSVVTTRQDRSTRIRETLLFCAALAGIGLVLWVSPITGFASGFISTAVIVLVINLGMDAIRRVWRRRKRPA